MKNILVSYIRDNKGIPHGVIVALKRENGTVGINYSFCRKTDRFNKDIGIKIAMGRALNNNKNFVLCPHEIYKKMNFIFDRAEKYFRISKEEIAKNNPEFRSYHVTFKG